MAPSAARLAFLAAFGLTVVGLAAVCLPHDAAVAAQAATSPLPLRVPLVDVMRANIEIPADGVWAAQGQDSLTDQEWLLADQDTVALANAASLISMPATGKQDAERLSKPDWGPWVMDIQKTALDLRAAAKAKDKMRFDALADHLTDTCQACHDKYRPEVPSDGVARYPFYPPRVLDKSRPPG